MPHNVFPAHAVWEQLKNGPVPVHSFLALQGENLLLERYLPPYDSTKLHRMFSVSKSITSLAVGCLLEDGLISLDHRITSYFPEFTPPGGFHPFIETMTIRHMLVMETCFSSSTYKEKPEQNWVESFFITAPSHPSGQIFLYDTSASHTLAALVKKLSNKGVLDYLRGKFLDSMGFSKDAYMIRDPFGAELGGSGLMARPMDLIRLGRYLLDTINTGTGMFADYLREAVSFQVPTVFSGQTPEEQLGYGYQFWSVRNGFAMYGMGGQYLLCYPKLDLVCAITADTQNFKGGNQWLLDEVFRGLKPLLGESSKLKLSPFRPPGFWKVSYRILENSREFTGMDLSFDSKEGNLVLYQKQQVFSIPFAFDHLKTGILSGYGQQIATKGVWADSETLYLPVWITDECVGSIHITIRLSKGAVTLWMKKLEETGFDEFQGFLEGREV